MGTIPFTVTFDKSGCLAEADYLRIAKNRTAPLDNSDGQRAPAKQEVMRFVIRAVSYYWLKASVIGYCSGIEEHYAGQ